MARLKTKWNLKDRHRTSGQTSSVVAVNIWHLACANALSLENEGFETTTQAQRLNIIAEFCAFATHMTDRMTHGRLDDEKRAALIIGIARRLAELLRDNRADAGDGDNANGGAGVGAGGGTNVSGNTPSDRADGNNFIDLFNQRSAEYAECNFTDTPGFTMRRLLGEHVRALLGARDNKWAADYVIDAEAPHAHATLKRVLAPLIQGKD